MPKGHKMKIYSDLLFVVNSVIGDPSMGVLIMLLRCFLLRSNTDRKNSQDLK